MNMSEFSTENHEALSLVRQIRAKYASTRFVDDIHPRCLSEAADVIKKIKLNFHELPIGSLKFEPYQRFIRMINPAPIDKPYDSTQVYMLFEILLEYHPNLLKEARRLWPEPVNTSSYLQENIQLKNEISELREKVQDLTIQVQNLEENRHEASQNPFVNEIRGLLRSNIFGTQQPEQSSRDTEYQFESDAWHLRRGRSSTRLSSRRGSRSGSGSSSGSGSRGRRYPKDPY